MKIRFGVLALVAMLAACSSQDQTKTGKAQKASQASATRSGVGSAISGYSNDSKRTLGSAPDRGELFGYKKGVAVLHKGAYTLRPIALSEEHALRGVATGMMTIPAPDGSQIKIRYQRHEESPDGNWSWIGRVVGGDQGREAIITFGEHAVFGSIPQANGPSLQLTTEHGIAYLVQADTSRLFRGTRVGGDTKVPAAYGASSAPEVESLVSSATQKIQAQSLAVSPKAVPASNTVDLVAGYSNGLATRLGGASIAVTKLVSLVAVANTALANSNINGQIRLVGALQVTYADNTDNGTALNELTGNNGTGAVTVPASLAPLRAARETYGADLVTLVRDFKSENNGCGIAWLVGAKQQPITVAGDAPFAYSVVSEGSYVNGTSTLYCEDITLVHELAHNMGSAHDAANAPDPGRYSYSYGYKTAVAQGNFFTVMAYGENNQTLYRVFSNPLITICGGAACGVANQADNARSLNQTVPVVSTFRTAVVPFANPTPRDINGDGRSDIFWRNQPAQQFSHWAMNGTTIASSIGKVMDGTYKLSGSGDFNGDGISDVLWINTTARFVVLWQSNGDGTYQQMETGGYAAGLKFSGIGDFNGDGRSDILWHDTAANQMFYWAMNGRIATPSAKFAMPGWYDIIAVGDFNADGLSDVAYASPSDVNLYINTAGTSFAGKFLAYRPAGWTFLGAADSNGDKNSDMYWRNNTSGLLTYWIVVNGAVSSTATYSPDLVLSFAALGDYNGDGRADIIWNRSEWRQLSMWTSQTSGIYNAAVVGYFPAGWEVVP